MVIREPMKHLYIDMLGWIGATMTVVFPFLNSLLPIFQFLGAVGGLVLLYYSIKHKRMEIKKLKGK